MMQTWLIWSGSWRRVGNADAGFQADLCPFLPGLGHFSHHRGLPLLVSWVFLNGGLAPAEQFLPAMSGWQRKQYLVLKCQVVEGLVIASQPISAWVLLPLVMGEVYLKDDRYSTNPPLFIKDRIAHMFHTSSPLRLASWAAPLWQ